MQKKKERGVQGPWNSAWPLDRWNQDGVCVCVCVCVSRGGGVGGNQIRLLVYYSYRKPFQISSFLSNLHYSGNEENRKCCRSIGSHLGNLKNKWIILGENNHPPQKEEEEEEGGGGGPGTLMICLTFCQMKPRQFIWQCSRDMVSIDILLEFGIGLSPESIRSKWMKISYGRAPKEHWKHWMTPNWA